jgi:hypothetical protein
MALGFWSWTYGWTKTGGSYAHTKGLKKIAQAGMPVDPPFDPQGLLLQHGYKVMHKADVDYRSNCQPFLACLGVIRSWSLSHPQHVPILIIVENKNFSGLENSDSNPERLLDAIL